jgi:hypothetical protein
MPSPSPISDGFRQAFREPAVVLAEIAWRWAFGLAALALTIACFFAYLNTLTVTRIELLALRSHSPWLVAGAIGHIVYGSGPRLARIAAILLPALFVLWIAAASFGRAATLKALLRRHGIVLGPQLGLNTLRASVTLASLIGYLGALILAGHAAAADGDNRFAIFLLIFVVLATVISIVRSRVNWFFYLAAIFGARDGDETFTAISKAAGLFRRNAGRFLGAGAVFGTIHGVLFAFAAIIWLLLLSLAGNLSASLIVVLLAITTLWYFALCDFLYIARLAAYVAVDEQDRTPPAARVAAAPEPMPPFPEPPSSADLPPMAEPGLSEGSTS